MGLSMANMIDPNLGNVPSLSQFFLIIGTLLFSAGRPSHYDIGAVFQL